MSETSRNHIATLLIIVAFMVFFLLINGLTFLAFGGDGVRTILSWSGYISILAVVLGILAVIVLLVAWIFNLATRNFVNIQTSNDNADVAKFGALKESLRAEREYDKDVRRAAMVTSRQAPMPKQIEQDDFYRLPMYDDGNTIDYKGNN